MDIFPKIINEKTVSEAERLVFDLIRKSNIGDGYCAFHSLLLPRHRYKYIGETDFPVLTPYGFLILEVKGGIISTERGEWRGKSKAGKEYNLSESPFEQAKNNMYSLMDMMINASMPYNEQNKLKGFGVIFPDCRFEVESAEIEQELILDARELCADDPVGVFIKRLERYWSKRLKGKPVKFTSHERKRIRNWLRPKYHGVKSLRSDCISLEQRLISLIDDQMDFLETAQGKKRIICRGGAGTGKTLVGLEYIRLKHNEGINACFLVPNKIFRNYLAGRGYHYTWIITLEELSNLPDESIEILAMDEAQDLMTLDHFLEIERVLLKGIEKGDWVILLDNQNQTGIDGNFDKEWFDQIARYAEADIILPRNIRNTIEVIKTTQDLTGRDIGKRGTGPGRKVDYVYYSDSDDLAEQISERFSKLEAVDISPGDITIISQKKFSDNSVAQQVVEHGYKLKVMSKKNSIEYPFNKISYASIRDFKGMESFVVVIDLGEFAPDDFDKSPLYVAITRAVGHLILACPDRMKKEIGKIQLKNIRAFDDGGIS